ncbi:MAG: hemerythrin domain-containing protein [Leptospirales bacterium]
MKLSILEELDEEHRIIEEVAGSLVCFSRLARDGKLEQPAKELKTFTRYFTKFLEGYHFKKETEIVFDALIQQGIPAQKGPIYYYELEHDLHKEQITHLEKFTSLISWSDDDKNEVVKLCEKFCAEVWEHIDKEDSVVFSEVEERVKGKTVKETQQKHIEFEKKHDRAAFLKTGSEFIEKYKPVDKIVDVIRGDGCMSCRYYGEGCSGIEHEWWTEHEWEDFFARNKGD